MIRNSNSKLTAEERQELVYLTGCALNGILADHYHVRQLKGLCCGQSVAEWASTLAIETHYRLLNKIPRYQKARLTRKTKLYTPENSL